jgi:pyruvate formate lyase activating enzyme
MQAEFVKELCAKLSGIHIAIQTSGFASLDTYKSVIDSCDFIMQDIKLYDSAAHKRYTGVGNEKILRNIEYLKRSGKPFVFRVPLIPSITDTEENLKAISDIAQDFPVELLRYNALAGAKYEGVGKKYTLNATENDPRSYLHYFKKATAK